MEVLQKQCLKRINGFCLCVKRFKSVWYILKKEKLSSNKKGTACNSAGLYKI